MSNGSSEAPGNERIRVEQPAPDVARVVLARPEAANAQDYLMLSEFNAALDRAARDPSVKVIIVAADGKHFSSGHDLRNLKPDMSSFPTVGTAAHFDAPGAEGYMDREREVYLGYCRRWRDIPKPTIAQVQGKAIAAGLMLAWPMDLIVCADDASFCDPVVTLGANGVEYFAHPYELGFRLAKDMLFTGRAISAQEAQAVGMVQRVFPRERLEEETLALAAEIAKRPAMTLAMTKRSVNLAQDAMGFQQTLEAVFAMHHLLHNHFLGLYGSMTPPGAEEAVRDSMRSRP
jgi:enoyl-CoA hydratase